MLTRNDNYLLANGFWVVVSDPLDATVSEWGLAVVVPFPSPLLALVRVRHDLAHFVVAKEPVLLGVGAREPSLGGPGTHPSVVGVEQVECSAVERYTHHCLGRNGSLQTPEQISDKSVQVHFPHLRWIM